MWTKAIQSLHECPAKDEKCHNFPKQGHYSRMCKNKKLRELKEKRKSNASVYHTCEEREIEASYASEGTMFYAEQIATVEEVHHIGSKAEFHSIKLNGHDVRPLSRQECGDELALQP